MNNAIQDVLINIIGTILGGLILTLVLFLLNEYGFTKPNLTGEWETIISIEKSSYTPFKDLTVEYKLHLLHKGNELLGSGEKIKDTTTDGKVTTFIREKRVVVDIDGYFERKFFGSSKIYLNINEEGRKRETRATYFLVLNNINSIKGYFISTAGDSSGKINMKKV